MKEKNKKERILRSKKNEETEKKEHGRVNQNRKKRGERN
jgi:hypothetical protein